MKYSEQFMGFVGEVSFDFNFADFRNIVSSLCAFYKQNSTSGQKLMIGFDTRYFAKVYAKKIAEIAATYGIKVFISSKFAPSSVLVTNALHKKSMGTVVLTGDENKASFLGIRAFDSKGFLVDDEMIKDFSSVDTKKLIPFQTLINKGTVEAINPSISYEYFFNSLFNFDEFSPSSHQLLFSPLFGSGDWYFPQLLRKRGVSGYSYLNEPTSDFFDEEPNPRLYLTSLYENMLSKNAELGFIVSPDCASFVFLYGQKILETKEIAFLLMKMYEKEEKKRKVILLDDSLQMDPSLFNEGTYHLKYASYRNFHSLMKVEKPLFSVDAFGRFYFGHHGAPDALMLGFHMVKFFNQKDLSPQDVQRTFNKIKNS